MATTREKARNTVNYLRLTPREHGALRKERTLHLEAQPPWPPSWVAQYFLRFALENACTKIRVRQGVHGDQTFDVMDLCTFTRMNLFGHLPRVRLKLVPASLATMRHAAIGNRADSFKGAEQVSVPQLPVSMTNGGQGEQHASRN
jgi:hypothetical protein